jgi:hypothetical protein
MDALCLCSRSTILKQLFSARVHFNRDLSGILAPWGTENGAIAVSSSEKVRTDSVKITMSWSSCISAVRCVGVEERSASRIWSDDRAAWTSCTSEASVRRTCGASLAVEMVLCSTSPTLAAAARMPTMPAVTLNGSMFHDQQENDAQEKQRAKRRKAGGGMNNIP